MSAEAAKVTAAHAVLPTPTLVMLARRVAAPLITRPNRGRGASTPYEPCLLGEVGSACVTSVSAHVLLRLVRV
ncbi:hypothetical protein GCM10012275_25790 [Longimycelium tulufanense]|uniref:Uncharacterized protein n=1 Tax=Longimycelium tulufanense TaxID=907463 RepID=A0A8J3FTZ3_9PSEU|nr:hypothetical protein GCM10012275_25790 [Longimycelium tulufanense]